MYYINAVQSGTAVAKANFLDRMKRWLKVSLIVELFFYTSLTLVKLALLSFFRRLGSGIHYFKYVWWPVLVLVLASYFGAVGNVHYKCLLGTTQHILSDCTHTSELNFLTITLKVNCGLDVFTDFLSKWDTSLFPRSTSCLTLEPSYAASCYTSLER